MATKTVFSLTTVSLPLSAVVTFLPSVAGIALPAGHARWLLTVDTTGLTAASALFDGALEYLVTGVWREDVAFRGAVAGPYANGSRAWTLSSTIGATDPTGALVGTYPTSVRLRVDSSPGLSLASITLAVT